MANEKRLIDANALEEKLWFLFKWYGQLPCSIKDKQTQSTIKKCIAEVDKIPTVVAVDVKQYESLLEQYHTLRENFIDYYCSGIPNVAPYCLNRCEDCVTVHGWCKYESDKCNGFNPAEVII